LATNRFSPHAAPRREPARPCGEKLIATEDFSPHGSTTARSVRQSRRGSAGVRRRTRPVGLSDDGATGPRAAVDISRAVNSASSPAFHSRRFGMVLVLASAALVGCGAAHPQLNSARAEKLTRSECEARLHDAAGRAAAKRATAAATAKASRETSGLIATAEARRRGSVTTPFVTATVRFTIPETNCSSLIRVASLEGVIEPDRPRSNAR